ncbi:hypothetical protein CFP56_018619 [Quercus suber]|uniref:CC-NBS-LRR protein n=1 Tax=Quercus suber TaxID=58331 RepID=A0AAW0M020_QUESU
MDNQPYELILSSSASAKEPPTLLLLHNPNLNSSLETWKLLCLVNLRFENPKVLFPQLKDLFLKDLPILKRFCIGSNIIFPSLTGMTIEQCPKLESFIFKPVSSEEMNSEEISRTAMQPLFNEKHTQGGLAGCVPKFGNIENLALGKLKNHIA